MKESDIKRALIESLVRDEGVQAIAQEFAFDFGRCRADVVCVRNNRLVGYEIKSAVDKTTRLPDQLLSYGQFFDYTYVVCDAKHLTNVESMASENVGVYLCAERGVKKFSPAKINRDLDYLIGLDSLPMNVLRRVFDVSARSKYEMCEIILRSFSKRAIRFQIVSYFVSKFGPQMKIFKSEVAKVVTLDDLRLLDLSVDEIV